MNLSRKSVKHEADSVYGLQMFQKARSRRSFTEVVSPTTDTPPAAQAQPYTDVAASNLTQTPVVAEVQRDVRTCYGETVSGKSGTTVLPPKPQREKVPICVAFIHVQ